MKKILLSLTAFCVLATAANAATTATQTTKDILKKNAEATKADLKDEAKRQAAPVTQAPAQKRKELATKQKQENKAFDDQIKAKEKEIKKLKKEDPVRNMVRIKRLQNEVDALTIKKDTKNKFYQKQIDAIK